MNRRKQERRERAAKRLDAQLVLGTKPTKEGTVPLTDKDTTRIKGERAKLKELTGK